MLEQRKMDWFYIHKSSFSERQKNCGFFYVQRLPQFVESSSVIRIKICLFAIFNNDSRGIWNFFSPIWMHTHFFVLECAEKQTLISNINWFWL